MRGSRSRSVRPPHPTAVLLIDTVIGLLEVESMETVTIAMVLERSGVSHGSLYHHFEDFSDLVEKAVVHRYIRRLNDSLDDIRRLLELSDVAEFHRQVGVISRDSFDPQRSRNRMERIEVLGATQSRPRLAASIARAQGDFTEEYAEILAEMQSRGWLRKDLSAHAIAAFIQAVVLGRIVDEVADRHVDFDDWNTVAMTAFRAILFSS